MIWSRRNEERQLVRYGAGEKRNNSLRDMESLREVERGLEGGGAGAGGKRVGAGGSGAEGRRSRGWREEEQGVEGGGARGGGRRSRGWREEEQRLEGE